MFVSAALVATALVAVVLSGPGPDATPRAEAAARLSTLPIGFHPNVGQADPSYDFVASGSGYRFGIAADRVDVGLSHSERRAPAASLRLLGSDPAAPPLREGKFPGTVNYFLGNDPTRWNTDVASFARVGYQSVYPGIDVVYYGRGGLLEHDFVVAPDADPTVIRFTVDGAESVDVTADGALVAHTPGGPMKWEAPALYQETGSGRRDVPGHYSLIGNGVVGFAVGQYDHGRPLVIDPVLDYATYLGGTNFEWATWMAVDPAGNVYLTGPTQSTNFPVVSPVQGSYGGGKEDVFVVKLNPAMDTVLYATYLGGLDEDTGRSIAVDGAGNAYLSGQTLSDNFPVTAGVFQPEIAGDQDLYVTKLTPSGTLGYSGYLGGGRREGRPNIAVDATGAAHVAAYTGSVDPPLANPINSVPTGEADIYIAKLSPDGSQLLFGTIFGGTDHDTSRGIALDPVSGDLYIAGWTYSTNFPTTAGAYQTTMKGVNDAWVGRVSIARHTIDWLSTIGGTESDQPYHGNSLTVDAAGSPYLVGHTYSEDFPTTPGAYQTAFAGGNYDGFLVKFATDGASVVYSTLLGGNYEDVLRGVAVDAAGRAWVGGFTNSANFPTVNPVQVGKKANTDATVSQIDATGSQLLFSTMIGGKDKDEGFSLARDSQGRVLLAGMVASSDFPVVNPVQGYGGTRDIFLLRVDPCPSDPGCTPVGTSTTSSSTTSTSSSTSSTSTSSTTTTVPTTTTTSTTTTSTTSTSTTSTSSTSTSTTSTTVPSSVIVNGGFEQDFVGWTNTGASIATSPVKAGAKAAKLGGVDRAQHRVQQSITVPAGTSLHAWAWVEGNDVSAKDQLLVQVQVGTTRTTLAKLTSASPHGTWVELTASLSAYANQTVTLIFRNNNDDTTPSTFYVDAVSVA